MRHFWDPGYDTRFPESEQRDQILFDWRCRLHSYGLRVVSQGGESAEPIARATIAPKAFTGSPPNIRPKGTLPPTDFGYTFYSIRPTWRRLQSLPLRCPVRIEATVAIAPAHAFTPVTTRPGLDSVGQE
jgi:hypothetical protein